MINNFTNYQNRFFDLSTELYIDDVSKLTEYEHEYRTKAEEYSNKNHVSVFYSLKHIQDGFYDYGQFFMVPVSEKDIDLLTRTYAFNHLLGIHYISDIKIITPNITGHEYEYECARYLESKGFINIEVTKGSGDQGIDVIAVKDGKRYGIQCKHYSNSVPNKAVQEAYAGAEFYGCDVAAVMTNSTYTKSAIELAQSIGVELWNY
jgi:restriction system protein